MAPSIVATRCRLISVPAVIGAASGCRWPPSRSVSGAVAVRVRVFFRRTAVRRPARVTDAVVAADRVQLDDVFQARQLDSVLHGHQQFVGGERLFEKIDSAQPSGPHRHLDIGLPGNHHHWRLDARGLQLTQQRKAVLARHDHVRENHVEALRLVQVERAIRVVAHHRFMPGQPERARERCQRICIVIHQQQFAHAASSIRKVAPFPGSLCTVIVPL